MGRKCCFLKKKSKCGGILFVVINIVINKQKCSVSRTSNAAETKQSAVFHFKTVETTTLL